MINQLHSYPRLSAVKNKIGLSMKRNYLPLSTLFGNGNTTYRLKSHSPSSRTTVQYQPSRPRPRSHQSKHAGLALWMNSTLLSYTNLEQKTRSLTQYPEETSLGSPQ